ncbi:MAG: ABC transporter ATP-binding protein [Candidatus Hydrogenedentota bacterium]|nr:MAG: ABC transporter ATP-binding protein [Candidatus Hydrogenedentota bacterium]
MIEVKNLTRKFGDVVAVNHFSFRVEKNEVVALLGLNGAGKTTTLRMLTGYLSPTEGSITIDGFSSESDPLEIKKRIGYLPEKPAFYPQATVREFLTYFYRLRKNTRDNETDAVQLAMEKTDLTDRADQKVGTLSAGYKKRVGIAQAIVHSPKILILDEPITDLDPLQIVEIRELIKELKKEHTILLSSHILSEVGQVADRYLFLREGVLVAEETQQSLHDKVHSVQKYKLKVEAKKEPIDLYEKLKEVAISVESKALENNVYEFILEAKEDIRPKVGKFVLESAYNLLALETEGQDLEKYFLQITSNAS